MFFRGKDFRQDYSRLKMVCALSPSVPLLALTATANKQDREEIKEVLGLSDCVDITICLTGRIFFMKSISGKEVMLTALKVS